MISLSIVCLVLLLLPFLLGYIHQGVTKRVPAMILYYRYFMLCNMVLAGLFVSARMFFDGQTAAQTSGWAFSPLYHLYAIAVLSMVVLALVTLFSRKSIMLAPAILWSAFLLLSVVANAFEIARGAITIPGIMVVHIIYGFAASIIMLSYAAAVNNLLKGKQHNDTAEVASAAI